MTVENELNYLIDDLSTQLKSPNPHRSRYYTVYNAEFINETSRNTGGISPYEPRRNTEQKGWYKEMSKEMGTPRSPTPGLRSHSPRPSSADYSLSSSSPRPVSPSILRSSSPKYATWSNRNRSVSPGRREKSVVIGPVTEMVKKSKWTVPEQEFYRYRDSRTGKPLPGTHTFGSSWPYGLDETGRNSRVEGRQSPSRARSRSPVPIHVEKPIRKARSVEPIQAMVKMPSPKRKIISEPSTPLPDWMKNLKHIVPEDINVPVPPKFGTLYHGGRRPNYAEAEVVGGPPCELCHKPITELRCVVADNLKYHCWHFVCTFCFKNLRGNDFHIGVDGKPYCNNDFRRMYPGPLGI